GSRINFSTDNIPAPTTASLLPHKELNSYQIQNNLLPFAVCFIHFGTSFACGPLDGEMSDIALSHTWSGSISASRAKSFLMTSCLIARISISQTRPYRLIQSRKSALRLNLGIMLI
ncbi:hypothetical protein N7471_008436, partial [Penicillium samsonianum]|uniref:uncharacterized protein n=1 Tax=Penicillium samsonianum TaxID=1882272 RepID=UPI002548DEC3